VPSDRDHLIRFQVNEEYGDNGLCCRRSNAADDGRFDYSDFAYELSETVRTAFRFVVFAACLLLSPQIQILREKRLEIEAGL